MAKSIESIEGIGVRLGVAFRNAGIQSVGALLEAGADRKGRRHLAQQTGISESRILRCVNMADLFRVNGIASQYAELLEGAGVDTVSELKNRNAENLSSKMIEVNGAKNLVRRTPSVKVISGWIMQARELPARVSH